MTSKLIESNTDGLGNVSNEDIIAKAVGIAYAGRPHRSPHIILRLMNLFLRWWRHGQRKYYRPSRGLLLTQVTSVVDCLDVAHILACHGPLSRRDEKGSRGAGQGTRKAYSSNV